MKFQFDAHQEFQLDAMGAITGLFEGQRRQGLELSFELGGIPAVPNALELSEGELLANLQEVQRGNGVKVDEGLRLLEEIVVTPAGVEKVRFPNFSVEMETGTGKTYVYIRTALELHRQYGFRKFIVVAPSVAIREGVLKTFAQTREHFRDLFENAPYRYYAYDSSNLSQVRQFALSDAVEFMVMTLAAFNKADVNVIHQSTDRLQGETPIHLVQAARPILILDEPQNMESEKSIAALATLHPLLALRYSATHRHPYNLVYRLTPAEAYRQGLVKRIEVASVAQENQTNLPYIRVNSITTAKQTITASLTLVKLMKSGQYQETQVTVKPGDSLVEKSGMRPIYAGYEVEEINPGGDFVRFANQLEVRRGEELGADKEAIFEAQIHAAVEEHVRKQATLHGAGVKVLTLFFIDRVDNYAGEEPVIRRLFDRSFERMKGRWPAWRELTAAEVQAAYFAQRRSRTGEVTYLDTKTGLAAADREAFQLIMQEKERLLSFEEPVAFIFSHSALREGWDNPNVFQICTLNQTKSEVKKRQEIGRGVRLCVNGEGERLHDERMNVLTVIANESYQEFVQQYQTEITEEYYAIVEEQYGKPLHELTPLERRQVEQELGPILPPKPANAGERAVLHVRQVARGKATKLKDGKAYELHPEFEGLWERISRKTRYAVKVDTASLILAVVARLDQARIPEPRVTVTKARVQLDLAGAFQAFQMSAAKTLVSLEGRFPLPNLLDVMANLMENTSPPMRVTRKTMLEILRRTWKKEAMVENPHEFAVQAVALIKEELAQQLIAGIRYQMVDEWYAMELLEPEMKTWKQYMVPAKGSLYDHVIVDSEVERKFAQALEQREDVRLYVKLPGWFKVPTPIGNYNPDWAIVMQDPDEPEGEKLYLVSETKGTKDITKLQYKHEPMKIACGRAHFRELGVRYEVMETAADLPRAGLVREEG